MAPNSSNHAGSETGNQRSTLSQSSYDRLFNVTSVGYEDQFTAIIPARRHLSRLFGGQVAAQALLAAVSTLAEAKPAHSLHTYFVAMGVPEVPVDYEVARIRDGRSFATRRVTASQEGRVILELLASFTNSEEGPDWAPPSTPPVLPPPPNIQPPQVAHLEDHLEIRLANPGNPEGWNIHPFWFRANPPVGHDPINNAVMLTYVSDIALMANARMPGYNKPMAVAASLDHALWFHRVPRVDEWIFFSTQPLAHIGTRGLVHGSFHTNDGHLIATVLQEGLLRPKQGTNEAV